VKEDTPGRVVAIADGEVMQAGFFYTCSTGKSVMWEETVVGTPDWKPVQYQPLDSTSGKKCEFKSNFVLIKHPTLKRDVLYGEATVLYVKTGDQVQRGQLLGLFTVCGMLHLEVYHATDDANAKRGVDLPWDNDSPDKPCPLASIPPPLDDPRPLLEYIRNMKQAAEGCHADGADIAVPPPITDPVTQCTDPGVTPPGAAGADGSTASNGAAPGDDPLGSVPAELQHPPPLPAPVPAPALGPNPNAAAPPATPK